MFSIQRGCLWEPRTDFSRIRVSLWRVRVSCVSALAHVSSKESRPLQTIPRYPVRTMARIVLGLAAALAISSQVNAQQYVYYPIRGASQLTYYTQPTYSYQVAGGYATQYAQPSYVPQYYQYTYAPQYYQPANTGQVAQTAYAPQATADGLQVIPASYTVPVAEPAEAQPQPVQAAPAAAYGSDPYGFLNWLNSTRASYGLGAVGYDQNLSNWASMNNSQQTARGLGHFVMGPARRQNSAMGGFPGAMWMASPAHRAALLDPTISWIGIAAAGAYWTFNAY